MGSSPGVQTGSYAGLTPTAVNPTDVLGAHAVQSQAQQNAFNQANANYQANLAGMYGLAGAAATGGMYGAMKSSSKIKDRIGDASGILNNLVDIDVDRWKYKPEIDDNEEHIGPYAEDFKEAFGVGDGVMINIIDAVGVLFAAVKELAIEVREMKDTV
jgi:hypothetical protein